jgi:MOSC domain-containing protein YiiM
MKPEILNIFVCNDKGKPMIELDYVEALTGLGLAGDRYALGKGAWSQNNPKKRQVTFIAIEAIQEANKQLDAPFLPEETRRNIVTNGIDLNSLVGKVFQIGLVVFKGTELCDPCKRPSVLAGKENFQEAYDQNGGLRAEVISGGMITIGEVTLKIN